MSSAEVAGSVRPALSQAELAERIRPRTISEVLDGAFGLYRQGFAQVTVAQLILAIPVIALCVLMPLGAGFWAILIGPSQRAMSYHVGMDRLLARERSMGQLLGAGIRAWPGIVLLTILQVVVFAVLVGIAVVPLGVPGVLLSASGSEVIGVVLMALGALVGLAATLAGSVYLYLVEAVFLFERDWNALMRSFRLVRGGFWKVALTALVAYFIVMGPAAVLQVAIVVQSGGFDESFQAATPEAWHGIAAVLVAVLLTPFAAHVSTLLWVDRRAVREGMDLAPESPDAEQDR